MKYSLRPDKGINVTKAKAGRVPLLILQTKHPAKGVPGVLWIHGGGYFLGMKEMVHMSRAIALVKNHNAVCISAGYRLAFQRPYPAAVNDCYAALKYMYDNADKLGIDRNRIIVGGESAGGGLAAAVCMMARDRDEIKVSLQLPLYPDDPVSCEAIRKFEEAVERYLGNDKHKQD